MGINRLRLCIMAVLLITMSGIGAASTIKGDIILTTQEEVNAFDPTITQIDGNLVITGTVDDLKPLCNLMNIDQGLSIGNTSDLVLLDGLSNLTTIGTLQISINKKLMNMQALDGLTSVSDAIIISENQSLSEINAFNKIVSLRHIRIFQNPNLHTISGFKNLSTLSLLLLLQDNDSLTDIRGFSSLSFTKSLCVERNPLLSEFCYLYYAVKYALQAELDLKISDNGMSCTPEEIVANGPCKNKISVDKNAFVVALQFLDALTGNPVGGVMCRLTVPSEQEWKVESTPTMNLLFGIYPYNTLFRTQDAAPGGTYVINFTSPSGWAFTGASSLALDVSAGKDFYSLNGNVFYLEKTGAFPNPDDGGGEPEIDEHPMIFVKGSPDFEQEPWSNVVDEDLEGWNGTGTLAADEAGSVWCIFRFRANKTMKFNYFFLQTDNGTADDAYASRQAKSVQVFYSAGSLDPAEFISLGTWEVKSPDLSYFKLNQVIDAKYVMLKVLAPEISGKWSQVVEFGCSWNKALSAANTASSEMTVAVIPETFVLEPNFPNPFNPQTTIMYQLPEVCNVRLNVYNLAGREVACLMDSQVNAGVHTMQWNASSMPSGIYLVRLKAGANTAMQRISLVK